MIGPIQSGFIIVLDDYLSLAVSYISKPSRLKFRLNDEQTIFDIITNIAAKAAIKKPSLLRGLFIQY